MTIAVVGPDGSGKSSYCNRFGKTIMHAIPKTRFWNVKDSNASRILHELLMAMEKLIVFIKLRKAKDIIMERCFVDAEVYGHLWSLKMGSALPLIICRLTNIFAYKPEVIHQLIVEPSKARPTRGYTIEEIGLLNDLFTFVIRRYGYVQYNYIEYDRGMIIIWNKGSNKTTIERIRGNTNGKGI